MTKAIDEIRPLTGLRFMTALYVFLFHMNMRWSFAHGFAGRVIGQGALGMSFFFVLSGFVLAYRYADGLDLKDYCLHRFARIYPMYAAVALATLPWFGVPVSWHDDAVGGLGRAVFLAVSDLFVIQAWFPKLFFLWNNGGSWSIAVEAFCYAVFPLLCPRLVVLSRRKAIWLLGLCCVVGALPGLSALLFGGDPMVFYMLPIFRLPEFVIGICACVLYRSGWTCRYPVWLQTGTLVAVIVYLGLFGDRSVFYISNDWLFLPFVAFMVLSLAQNKGMWAALLASRPAAWLGRISYSFYSCQSLLLLMLIAYHDRLLQAAPVFQSNMVLLAATFAVLLSCAALGHYAVEVPMRRRLIGRYGRRPPVVV